MAASEEKQVVVQSDIISDEQIVLYAKELLKGSGDPLEAFEVCFGYVPTRAQIIEIESHPLYRETLDSVTKLLQARLISNAVSVADKGLQAIAQNLQITQQQIQQLLATDDFDVKKYSILARLQIDTVKLVKDEQIKAAKVLAGEDEEDDLIIWEKVRNGER